MRIWRMARYRLRRGSAAIEFAIACPVMLIFFGGLVDFGLALWDKSTLANAVAQGAYYAYVTGTNVASTNVQTLVQNSTSLNGVHATVTGPACYCITGTPLALVAATCNTACSDTTTSGYFVKIVANYTYPSILPVYSHLNNPTLTESTIVRLK
jgi:Flp pilus assembly protein TadG